MPHQTPNPHDAEEQLRPALSDVFETRSRLNTVRGDGRSDLIQLDAALGHAAALETALDQTLDLLGVPHA